MKQSHFLPIYFIGLFCFFTITISAQLPSYFSDELVTKGFEQPIGFAFDHRNYLFVWEKDGRVFVVDSTYQFDPQQQPIIDIREEVGNWRDHGLMGFALDPNFQYNGHVYLLYGVDRHHLFYYGTDRYHPDSTATFKPSIGRLTRYTIDVNNYDKVLADSRKVLIGQDKSNGIPLIHESHSVNDLLFGTDGTLLVSIGDGNSNSGYDIGGDGQGSYATQAIADGIITEDQNVGTYRAQYLGSMNGKILRIDPETGQGLPSNPFYDATNPDAVISKVWALGLRNPYRMSLKPNTGSHYPADGNPGTLYVGDVGANRWEEIDVVNKAGQNFGWPLMEGLERQWQYWAYDVPLNPYAPNPLYATGDCNQAFFDYRTTFKQATRSNQQIFLNPCDESQVIPNDVPVFIETLPMITWNHRDFNPPNRAMLPAYNEEGQVVMQNIEEAPTVEGDNFAGYSAISGTFYEGDVFPEEYHNTFFGMDYSGWIKLFVTDEKDSLKAVVPFHDDVFRVIMLKNHPDGCLYYLNYFRNELRKICYGGNPAPVPVITYDQQYGSSPLTVTLTADSSYHPFDWPLTYQWDLGDGTTATGNTVTHTFNANSAEPTSFTVKLTAIDTSQTSGTSELLIALNNTPPQVAISSFKDGDQYAVDNGTNLLMLQAEVSDAEHELEQLKYEWRVFLHHNAHFHEEPIVRFTKHYMQISPLGCGLEDYWYRVQLKVTDPDGLYSIDERSIYPDCGEDYYQLATWEAQSQSEGVDLNWSFEQLQKGTIIELQRSTNQFDYELLASFTADGQLAFQHTDTQPERGYNHYRLKLIAPNRAFDFTPRRSVVYPIDLNVSLFPNPIKDVLTVEIQQTEAENIIFDLYNTLGQIVKSYRWSADIGQYFKATLPTKDLAKGLYFYELRQGELIMAGGVLRE